MSDQDETNWGKRSRRKFLKSTGISLAGLLIGSGSAAASNIDGKGPLKTEAKVIKRFKPQDEHYTVEKKSISPTYKEKFGSPVIRYEPEIVPRKSIPDEYKDPDRPFTIQYRDELVVGTKADHLIAEKQRQTAAGVQIQAQFYSGPKFVYQSASGAEEDDIYERTAPINIAWGSSLFMDTGDVKSLMQNNGWTKCFCVPSSSTRYIFYNGSAHSQDTHIYDEIFLTEQRHIRVWDVFIDSSSETLLVIGNIHKDPYDHNQIGNSPWHFDESRDIAMNDWKSWGPYSTEYQQTGYTQWGTHDGAVGLITL